VRIVAVADTHTFQEQLGTLPDGDVFVHAGDLLRRGSLDELAGVAAWIRALPHRHKVVVAGNHDWCFARERAAACDLLGAGVVYLEDEAVTVDGAVFYGSPWQPAYNDWAYNLPRGPQLAEKWAAIPAGVDVLITHGPPYGIGDDLGSGLAGRQGCVDLRLALPRIQPRVHLFGHIHQAGGAWSDGATLYANVTTWECARAPTVVDLDLATRTAVPVVVPSPEFARR
jgi:predicted phosphodiesterase